MIAGREPDIEALQPYRALVTDAAQIAEKSGLIEIAFVEWADERVPVLAVRIRSANTHTPK